MSSELQELLEHSGVKGMRWGVRKSGDSSKTPSTDGTLKSHFKSLKRERSWNKQLKNADNMSTKDIQKVSSRIQMENDLKRLSKKADLGSTADRKDYLKRAGMDDLELGAKVQRLRAKDNLMRTSNDATKKQREVAMKIVSIAAPLAVKYATTHSINKKDVLDAFINPGGAKAKVMKDIVGVIKP